MGEEKKRRKRPLSGTLELLFGEGPVEAPPLVFLHIQKTAGTSFREVIRANLPAARLEVHKPPRGVALASWYAQTWSALAENERRALRCAMSHSANYLLPIIERPVEAVTVVRDPVDRVLSRYAFARRRPPRQVGDQERDERRRAFEEFLTLDLGELYTRFSGMMPASAERVRMFSQFFNGQTRALLEPHYDIGELQFSSGPPPDADRWRERLARVLNRWYMLGAQERLDGLVSLMARRRGWRIQKLPRLKVSSERLRREDLTRAEMHAIVEHNWLDGELHLRALGRSVGW